MKYTLLIVVKNLSEYYMNIIKETKLFRFVIIFTISNSDLNFGVI